ncbi:hypothetical protein [Novosphingobium sp. ZW T3_23]|uniref:hypothetical protein n=1 Tax=Novosphingobium sp. ZW T3_23 TaxID=3378084 RepID=UPI003854CEBF
MSRLGRSAVGFFSAGGLFLALGGIPPANAQDAATQGPETQEAAKPAADETPPPASSFRPAGRGGTGWTLIVSPYVWGASLGGDIGLAGLQSEARLPFGDIFKHLDLAAMGNLEVVNGRWGGYLDAQHVKTSQSEQVLSLPVDLRIRTTRVAGGFYYKAWIVPLSGETAFGVQRSISFEPTAGLRWTDLKASAAVAPLGQEISKGANWVDPFVGLRMNADLSRHWNLFAQADAGGFGAGSDISVNAVAMLGYRTRVFGQRTILRAGYRFIYEDYDQPDFTGRGRFVWDMQQRGPLLGLSMLF